MDLSFIVASYLNDSKEEKERDPERLFISDIGKCRREIAYRLLGTDKDPETEQELINKTIMFDLAERIEANLIAALNVRGMLIEEQGDVAMPDRENWGGRFDILAEYGGRRIIEVKSIYPGAFKYDLSSRYIQHHHQAMAYHHYCLESYQLESEPILAYFDRGGQNTPQEVPVAIEWASTCLRMDELDLMRNELPTLPERLEKTLNVRSYGKDLVLEPDGRCKKPYCKYTDECKQDMSTSCMASRTKSGGMFSPWVVKKAAHGYEDKIEKYINDTLEEIL